MQGHAAMPAAAEVVMKLAGDKLDRGNSRAGRQDSLLSTAPQFSRSFSYVEGPVAGTVSMLDTRDLVVLSNMRACLLIQLCSKATSKFCNVVCLKTPLLHHRNLLCAAYFCSCCCTVQRLDTVSAMPIIKDKLLRCKLTCGALQGQL